MKIFDCFTFYNEFDILELRLQEHWNYVDYFVIAEANKTHQGHSKRFLLEDNWDRYKDYHDKIIHIKVEDMPTHDNAWVLENYQRNALARGLQNAQSEDVMIVSDCDEIMRDEVFNFIKKDNHNIWTTRCPMFYFKLNYMMIAPQRLWINHVAARVGKKFGPQEMRNMTLKFSQLPINYADNQLIVLKNGGWHFTYFGSTEFAINKLRNFAHQESLHLADKINVDECIARKGGIDPNYSEKFEYVEIDDYFPKTVLKNLDRWKNYILPNPVAKVVQLLS